MLFEVNSKVELATLPAVEPGEIDRLLHRLPRYYRADKTPKRDGSIRRLWKPSGPLKLLQKKIHKNILSKSPWLPCVHGGVADRSVLTNAQHHVGKAVVFSLDIKDFFPSVRPDTVLTIFRGLGFAREPAWILARLTTWKFQLPQGASTSTALANLALLRMDSRIWELARQHGFSYTRYVDDLAISGSWRLLKFLRLIRRIIEAEGYSVKNEKVAVMHAGIRQVVTQIVVNDKPNVTREKRAAIRLAIKQYNPAGPDPVSIQSLCGQVSWLRYVNPPVGLRLAARVNGLK